MGPYRRRYEKVSLKRAGRFHVQNCGIKRLYSADFAYFLIFMLFFCYGKIFIYGF